MNLNELHHAKIVLAFFKAMQITYLYILFVFSIEIWSLETLISLTSLKIYRNLSLGGLHVKLSLEIKKILERYHSRQNVLLQLLFLPVVLYNLQICQLIIILFNLLPFTLLVPTFIKSAWYVYVSYSSLLWS